ncbi:MAG TPA: hypothetical protein VFB59_05620 [Candidatus Saccharimonadales bacterium]|nr:hypothetical protein [Candidatus Saccharimonadales bacterium]
MSEVRRFGETQPPVADPLDVRDVLLNRLGSLFMLVAAEGTWGGGVEPKQPKRGYDTMFNEEALVIGGVIQFGTEMPARRRMGVIYRLSEHGTGSYFVTCEWGGEGFSLDYWLAEPRSERKRPLQFTHLLPQPGVYDPQVVDLDLYALSTLNLTTFTDRHTDELLKILESPPPPRPDLYKYPFY